MTSEHDFYLRRDLRTAYYVQGTAVEPRPVQICWGEDAARSPAGQVLLLALSNQLARFCRCAGFSGPNASLLVPAPLGGTSLHEALTTGCYRIDPCGRWVLGEVPQTVYRLGVGRQSGEADLFLSAADWLAYAVDRAADLPPHADSASDVLGAGMAACIGAANAFKVSLGLPQPLIYGTFSLWSYGRDSQALQGPPLVATDLGDVLMVGAGAVAAALVYWLSFLPVSGRWDIVDHDEVQLDNTNRSLLFTAEDAGWEDLSRQKKASVLARYLEHAQPHDCWFDEFETEGRRWDLILPLANERKVRGLLQASRPPLMIHATTSPNWQTQLHRHRPVRDRCLACRLPDTDLPPPACAAAPLSIPDPGQGRPPDAALPFLSAAAGLLIAADLLRLGLGGYESEYGNLFTLDWYSDMGRPTVRHEQCQAGCSGWGDPAVRRILNHTTRWYDLDQAASSIAEVFESGHL
jgi:ThiF family